MIEEVELCGVKFDLHRFKIDHIRLFVDVATASKHRNATTVLRVQLESKRETLNKTTKVINTVEFDMTMVEQARDKREMVVRAVRNALAEVLMHELESALLVDGVPLKESGR